MATVTVTRFAALSNRIVTTTRVYVAVYFANGVHVADHVLRAKARCDLSEISFSGLLAHSRISRLLLSRALNLS